MVDVFTAVLAFRAGRRINFAEVVEHLVEGDVITAKLIEEGAMMTWEAHDEFLELRRWGGVVDLPHALEPRGARELFQCLLF